MPKEIVLPEFIFASLNTYGNTIVPKKCIDKYGKRQVRGKLTRFCERPVRLKQSENGYFIAEKV